MKLLIIDTETTGIGADSDICEIAATVYNVGDSESRTGAIASISTLLPVPKNPAEAINGISADLTMIDEHVSPTISLIQRMSWSSDYAVAFNAEFDQRVTEQLIPGMKWLCAMKDFDWGYPPNKYGAFRLVDLALWLGIGVSTTHRAADDVRLLVECFNRRRKDLPEMIEKAIAVANSPLIKIKALVSYENRKLASDAGFIWNGETKHWIKSVRECKLDQLINQLIFEVEICEEK